MAAANLENQLHSAQKNLLFLQREHAGTLKGLHAEIRRLQQHCTGAGGRSKGGLLARPVRGSPPLMWVTITGRPLVRTPHHGLCPRRARQPVPGAAQTHRSTCRASRSRASCWQDGGDGMCFRGQGFPLDPEKGGGH